MVGGFIKQLVRSRQRSLSSRFILPRRERSLLTGNIRKDLPSGKDYSRKRLGKCAGERFTHENFVYTDYLSDKDPFSVEFWHQKGMKIHIFLQHMIELCDSFDDSLNTFDQWGQLPRSFLYSSKHLFYLSFLLLNFFSFGFLVILFTLDKPVNRRQQIKFVRLFALSSEGKCRKMACVARLRWIHFCEMRPKYLFLN